MSLRTGNGKGRPPHMDRVTAQIPLRTIMNTDKPLKQSLIDAVNSCDWIPNSNDPYLIMALGLADQWDTDLDRRDRIAEKLLAVLLRLFTPETVKGEDDAVDALITELRINETKVASV